MSYRRLVQALLNKRPYFGPVLRSLQGPPNRHKYFFPTVRALSSQDRPFAILEIGSWAGASAISWAAALQKLQRPGRILCVDSWRPYFDLSVEHSPHYRDMTEAARSDEIQQLFKHNIACSGYGEMIDSRIGDSVDVLPTLTSESFDIVYIDGSHIFDGVLFDIREAKRLIKQNGIICGDDLEAQLHELSEEEAAAAPRERSDYIYSQRLDLHYHPGVAAAVAGEFGRVPVWEGFWAIQSASGRWIEPAIDTAQAELPDHIAEALTQPEGETSQYVFASAQGRYFAFSKQVPLSQLEVLADRDDLPNLIYSGDTLDEVRNKTLVGPTPAVASPSEPLDLPQLIEHHRGFNLVMFHGNMWGIREALGPVDVTLGEEHLVTRYGNDNIVVHASAPLVKTQIELIELQQQMRTVIQRLQLCTDAIETVRSTQNDLGAERTKLLRSAAEHSRSNQEQFEQLRADLGAERAERTELLRNLAELSQSDQQQFEQFRADLGAERAERTELLRNLAERSQSDQQQFEQLRAELSEWGVSTNSRHSSTIETLNELRLYIDRLRDEQVARNQALESSLDHVQRFTDELQAIVSQQRASLAQEMESQIRPSIESLTARNAELEQNLQRLHEELRELRYGPPGQRAPHLLELYRGFRLLRSNGRFYGIRGDIPNGEALLSNSLPEAEHGGESVLVGESRDSVRARIDALLAETAVREMAAQLQAALGKPLNLAFLDE